MSPVGAHDKFRFLHWEWDVSAAQAYAEAHHEVVTINIAGAAGILMVVGLDQDHVADVDLEEPILVGAVPGDVEYAPMPIDGWHRIRKALEAGVTELPGRALSKEESDMFCRKLARTLPRRTTANGR